MILWIARSQPKPKPIRYEDFIQNEEALKQVKLYRQKKILTQVELIERLKTEAGVIIGEWTLRTYLLKLPIVITMVLFRKYSNISFFQEDTKENLEIVYYHSKFDRKTVYMVGHDDIGFNKD